MSLMSRRLTLSGQLSKQLTHDMDHNIAKDSVLSEIVISVLCFLSTEKDTKLKNLCSTKFFV